jgi:hypothetical protein
LPDKTEVVAVVMLQTALCFLIAISAIGR